jgi:CDGSH-type Zn-finger protein
MARLVRHEAMEPIEIKPQQDSVWVCACGLSQDLPYCDGSHAKTTDEKPGEVCVYDRARQRIIERRTDE